MTKRQVRCSTCQPQMSRSVRYYNFFQWYNRNNNTMIIWMCLYGCCPMVKVSQCRESIMVQQTSPASAFVLSHKQAVIHTNSGFWSPDSWNVPDATYNAAFLENWFTASEQEEWPQITVTLLVFARLAPKGCQCSARYGGKSYKRSQGVDLCQAEVCVCASPIWASGKEFFHFLFPISSTDSFSNQNKKALYKQMWVMFSGTFMSRRTGR